MTLAYRGTSPHTRQPHRPDRLVMASRLREAAIEREPELLPCICPDCGSVLGLAKVDEALFCVDCGVWAEPIEDLAALAEVHS